MAGQQEIYGELWTGKEIILWDWINAVRFSIAMMASNGWLDDRRCCEYHLVNIETKLKWQVQKVEELDHMPSGRAATRQVYSKDKVRPRVATASIQQNSHAYAEVSRILFRSKPSLVLRLENTIDEIVNSFRNGMGSQHSNYVTITIIAVKRYLECIIMNLDDRQFRGIA
jgi:hypothetical protein